MDPIERSVDAAWAHLEARHEAGKSANDPAYIERERGLIDGIVDMDALVRAVIAAIREPSVDMTIVGGNRKLLGSGDMWRAMIDKLLEEGR